MKTWPTSGLPTTFLWFSILRTKLSENIYLCKKLSLEMYWTNYSDFVEQIPISKNLKSLQLRIGFEVFTKVPVKGAIYWDVTYCSQLKFHRRFRGLYCFHFHGRRLSQARNMQKECNQNLACSQVYMSEHAVTKSLLRRVGTCLSLDERQYNMTSLRKFEMDNFSLVSVNYLYEVKE